jgi:chemotaxis protein CheZ
MTDTEQPSRPDAFNQLGAIARDLLESLRELGFDRSLGAVAAEIPDARDRLTYVGKLTEDAAHRVLATVEKGLPECNQVAERGRELAQTIRRRAQGELSPMMCKAMMKQCGDYAERAADFAQQQNAMLTEIMMTQSFQDLSGQVIKKVVDIISRTESQLLNLLVDTAPVAAPVTGAGGALEGPQVPDKALKQDDVDDLLASLGF